MTFATDKLSKLSPRWVKQHILFIDIFSFVVAPVLATLVVDPSCVYFVFRGVPETVSSYSVQVPYYSSQSLVYSDGTTENVLRKFFRYNEQWISLRPSWEYSYQCSSVVIRRYTPVLLFSYIMSGLIIPPIVLAIMSFPQTLYPVLKYLPAEYSKLGMLALLYMACSSASAAFNLYG